MVLEGETSRRRSTPRSGTQAQFEGLVDGGQPRGLSASSTKLTPELIEEGYVREIISKMQMMRKEVDYDVTQRVDFAADGDPLLLEVLRQHQAEISGSRADPRPADRRGIAARGGRSDARVGRERQTAHPHGARVTTGCACSTGLGAGLSVDHTDFIDRPSRPRATSI